MAEGVLDLLTIGQFCFLFTASLFVFISLTTLIFKLNKQSDGVISQPIRINMIAWIVASMFNLAYVSISVVSRILPTVDSEVVFWTGSTYFACTTSVSLSVFFLTFDRCCILLKPNQLIKNKLSTVNGIAVAVQGLIFLIILFKYERPNSHETECEVFTCVAAHHGVVLNATRCVFGIINSITAATFFFLLLRYNRHRSSSVNAETSERRKSSVMYQDQPRSLKSRGNLFAGIAVISQIVFNFLPNLITFVFVQVFGYALSTWIGPAVSSLTQLDALLSTAVYLKIIGGRLIKSNKETNTNEMNRS